ncbi:hypothetical protein [Sphingomonas flavescens]|uniref:hypothetical protein n=1 Tax=Sphingomonas flavescens TaxID=3132797 RepID=UPI002804D4DF|nr:hypothetical protein [Sphingomonas limnosediminicola]
MPFAKAVIWSLLGAYFLLPSALDIDLPLLPSLDKMSITAVAVLLLCWVYGAEAPRPTRSPMLYLFATAFIISPILTSFTNSYELSTAGKSIPGYYPLDGLKFAGRNVLLLVPMYIGSRFLSTNYARAALLKAMPAVALVYSLPMLFEIRMSPQLHRWVYGYFPHESFAQQIRGGGFRPVVFLNHGLALATFIALALLATVVLWRMKARIFGQAPALVAPYIGGLLILCKSLGPVIYTVIFAPVIMFLRPRSWVKIVCAASLFVCAYPFLRNNNLSPLDLVSKVASSVSADRLASFDVRVENEDALLAKANEKPFLGWGGWGRNRIFDQWTGQDISVTDGGWIIYYGVFGWFGYLSLFGLIAVASFRALKYIGKQMTPENLTRGGLALLMGVYVLDSIPNGAQLTLIFIIAGSIASTAKEKASRPLRPSQLAVGKPATV